MYPILAILTILGASLGLILRDLKAIKKEFFKVGVFGKINISEYFIIFGGFIENLRIRWDATFGFWSANNHTYLLLKQSKYPSYSQ